jgi:hypothetical protein
VSTLAPLYSSHPPTLHNIFQHTPAVRQCCCVVWLDSKLMWVAVADCCCLFSKPKIPSTPGMSILYGTPGQSSSLPLLALLAHWLYHDSQFSHGLLSTCLDSHGLLIRSICSSSMSLPKHFVVVSAYGAMDTGINSNPLPWWCR